MLLKIKAKAQKVGLMEKMQLRGTSASKEAADSDFSHETVNLQLQGRQRESGRCGSYWSEEQEQVFLEFWMEKVAAGPFRLYSFDNPLQRCQHFRELSRLLRSRLGPLRAKGHQQCKSKFATIRRRIHRDKLRGRRPTCYGFIDYIMEEGERWGAGSPALQRLLAQLRRMRETDSDFMVATKKLLALELRESMELKNNCIYVYLKDCDQLPQAAP